MPSQVCDYFVVFFVIHRVIHKKDVFASASISIIGFGIKSDNANKFLESCNHEVTTKIEYRYVNTLHKSKRMDYKFFSRTRRNNLPCIGCLMLCFCILNF